MNRGKEEKGRDKGKEEKGRDRGKEGKGMDRGKEEKGNSYLYSSAAMPFFSYSDIKYSSPRSARQTFCVRTCWHWRIFKFTIRDQPLC